MALLTLSLLLSLPHPAAPTATIASAATAAPARQRDPFGVGLLDCSDMGSLLLAGSMDAEPLPPAL